MNIIKRENVGTGVTVLMILAMFLVVTVTPTMVEAARWADTRGNRGIPGQKHHRPILGIWKDPQISYSLRHFR